MATRKTATTARPPARGFTFDPVTQRYRNPRGAFVSRKAVRDAVDVVTAKSDNRAKAITLELRAGRLSVTDWAAAMRAEVRRAHLMNAAAAKGGWAQLTPADFGRIGQRLRFQYGRLEQFAGELADGAPIDGRTLNRAGMYSESGRSTFHAIEESGMAAAGFDEYRNVLGTAEHCRQCPQLTALDWQPIGTLPPIGARQCLTRDRCRWEYRISATGATA